MLLGLFPSIQGVVGECADFVPCHFHSAFDGGFFATSLCGESRHIKSFILLIGPS